MKTLKTLFLLLPLVLWLAGCAAPGSKAFTREQAWQSAGTNAVSIIQRDVVPYIPAPYNGVVEGALAVAIAGLGLWHKSLTARLDAHVAASGTKPNAPPA